MQQETRSPTPPNAAPRGSRLRIAARCFAVCMALTLGLAPRGWADSASASFQATASVAKACTFSAPSTLAFGTYDPANASPLAAATNFNVMCTSGTSYAIGMSAGVGAGATGNNRLLTSATAAAGSNTLSYGLYRDAAHTVSWDNSGSSAGFTGTGASQAITVYGQIPSRQFSAAPSNDYSDTVTMTVSY